MNSQKHYACHHQRCPEKKGYIVKLKYPSSDIFKKHINHDDEQNNTCDTHLYNNVIFIMIFLLFMSFRKLSYCTLNSDSIHNSTSSYSVKGTQVICFNPPGVTLSISTLKHFNSQGITSVVPVQIMPYNPF